MSAFGTFAALLVGLITVKLGFNWRYAFLFGAGIALIGTVARSSLRETPEFVNAKNKFILKNTSSNILFLFRMGIHSLWCASEE